MKTKTIQISEDGTKKYLLELEDGNLIETVLMTHPYGQSVCVSSQAGCNMGCAFCASGLLKKIRNLTAEEMLGQVLATKEDVSHIVVMGTGEPFDNYEEVIRFCNTISDPKLLSAHFQKLNSREADTLKNAPGYTFSAVAPRHITVSTCGIVPKIYEFTETEKRFNLAISLHAPNNELRNQLMPVNKKYPLDELIPAAAEYCRKTKRRITFEYILLEGVNDSEEHAEELASLLNNDSFYVNLIPYNNVNEFGFRGSEKEKALRFYDILMKNGLKATLRKEHGSDIAAACGQLRLNHQ